MIVSYCLLLALGLVFWEQPAMRSFLSGSALFSASMIAGLGCLLAAGRISAPANTPWVLLASAAAVSSLSHASLLLLPTTTRISGIHYLWLASYALLLGALILAVHQSESGRLSELALDVALILAATTLAVLRWAPGTHISTRPAGAGGLLVLFGPVLAIAGLLIAIVLVSAPGAGPMRALASLVAALSCLLISTLPQIFTAGPCCHTGESTIFAGIGVWVFVGYAGFAAWESGEALAARSRERLRQFVAPAVAIVLATVSIDAAFRHALDRRAALALGVLGALVAVRLADLLNATRLQVAERRELAHTRALVEVSRALAGKNDLDTTLRIVTKWATRVLNARAAAVELLSSDGQTLVLRAAEGLADSAVGMTFAVDTSFTGWVILNGEARVTAHPQRDPFITTQTLKLVGSSPLAAVPLRYPQRVLGVLTCIGNRPFDNSDLDLLRAFANQTALALEDARLFEQVRALSITDPLTGLANRRLLDRELTREFAAATRGRKLVAVMFDLDDFKQHNDKYGHVAGDEALRLFADALRSSTRKMNLAARYGGDEFFTLLAEADMEGADVFVRRVRERFRRSMDAAGWPPLQVSAGTAEYRDDMTSPEDLVLAADRALYMEKSDANVKA